MKLDGDGNVVDPNQTSCLEFIGWAFVFLAVVLCIVGAVVSILYLIALIVVG